MITVSCPHCGNIKDVIRFGYNRSGTPRCRCGACSRTFTLSPRSRALSPEKEALIERALVEHMPQQRIARMLQVSRNTVRQIGKKGPSV